jgi:hypothetical protein
MLFVKANLILLFLKVFKLGKNSRGFSLQSHIINFESSKLLAKASNQAKQDITAVVPEVFN